MPVILATQEDPGSKSAQANGLVRPPSQKALHKNRAGGVAQGEGPEFKPLYCQKKKKIKEIQIEKLEKPSCEGRAQKRGKGKKKIV
jgi:hypothetical protein